MFVNYYIHHVEISSADITELINGQVVSSFNYMKQRSVPVMDGISLHVLTVQRKDIRNRSTDSVHAARVPFNNIAAYHMRTKLKSTYH